jgi:DNA-directed RNA polymerase specialized sigma24 family protein
MTIVEREALLLDLLAHVTPTIRRYAATTSLDFEDMRQDAVIHILSVLDAGIEQIPNLQAYISLRVRSRIIDKIRYTCRRAAVSLEAEISDQDITLADLIPDPHGKDPLTILIIKERIDELVPLADQARGNRGRIIRELQASVQASLESEDKRECAWCLREQGIIPVKGSHGICQRHADQERERLAARRAAV